MIARRNVSSTVRMRSQLFRQRMAPHPICRSKLVRSKYRRPGFPSPVFSEYTCCMFSIQCMFKGDEYEYVWASRWLQIPEPKLSEDFDVFGSFQMHVGVHGIVYNLVKAWAIDALAQKDQPAALKSNLLALRRDCSTLAVVHAGLGICFEQIILI